VVQAIFSRPSFYDGSSPVLNVDTLLSGKTPPRFWLNVQVLSLSLLLTFLCFINVLHVDRVFLLLQNAAFYAQYGIKAADNIIEILRAYPTIEFVSSPDIGFLKSIAGKTSKAKVVFQLLNAMDVEASTKQPYGNIIKDLVAIKSFASGIMVPKEFIYPVKPDKYLGPPTTLVADAHKLGLDVYASGFANDLFAS
jgi:hypothetical protein